eukprot:scaffold6592_cov30-Tisochrysis_lutea.AAC.5
MYASTPSGPITAICSVPACASESSRPGSPATAAGASDVSRTASSPRWSFSLCSAARRWSPSVALISSLRPSARSTIAQGVVPSSPVPTTTRRTIVPSPEPQRKERQDRKYSRVEWSTTSRI